MALNQNEREDSTEGGELDTQRGRFLRGVEVGLNLFKESRHGVAQKVVSPATNCVMCTTNNTTFFFGKQMYVCLTPFTNELYLYNIPQTGADFTGLA